MQESVETLAIMSDEPGRQLWPIARRRTANVMPPMVSYAQNFEDVVLRRALQDIAHGFYVDIGAWDPIVDSVTASFYENGWHGINVEPNPQYFTALEQARTRDTNLACVVSDKNGTCLFTIIEDTGLSSGVPATIDASVHPEACRQKLVTLPSVTLEDVLKLAGDHAIDFLKIDAEGMEANIINAASFVTHRPRIIVVEALQVLSQIETHHAWEGHLLAHSYEFAWFDGLNRFYVRREDQWRRALFSVPPCLFDNFRTPTLAAATRSLQATIEQLQSCHQAALAGEAAANAQSQTTTQELARLQIALGEVEQQLRSEIQAHLIEKEAAEAKAAEFSQAIAERDTVQAALTSKLTGLTADYSQVVSDRQTALVENELIKKRLETSLSERAQALTERDMAVTERNRAVAERDAAVTDRHHLRTHHDVLIAERRRLVEEQHLLIGERDWLDVYSKLLASSLRKTAAERDGLAADAIQGAKDRARQAAERHALTNELYRLVSDQILYDGRYNGSVCHKISLWFHTGRGKG